MKKAMHSLSTYVAVIAAVTMWSTPSYGASVNATDNAFANIDSPTTPDEQVTSEVRTAGPARRVGYVRIPLSGPAEIGGIAAADITSASLDVYITKNGDGDTVRFYVLDDNAQWSVTNLTETTWTGGTDGTIASGNNLTATNMPHGPFLNVATNLSTPNLTEIGNRRYPGDGLDNDEDNLLTQQVVQIAVTDLAAFKTALSNDSNLEITLVIQSENIVDGSGTEFSSVFNSASNPIPALTVLSGPDTTAPSTPSGLEVVGFYDAVDLKWNPTVEADVASINLYRSTSSGSFVDPPVATLDYFAHTYTDTNVVNGTTYYYAISASDEVPNESALSTQVVATPEPAPPPIGGDVLVIFGSDNDGLGGFTESTSANTNEIWTLNAGSVQYRNQGAGTLNSSFLGEFVLDRSPGKRYKIEGELTLTDGYADDNNRVGIYLFGDFPEVPNQSEVGAIGLIYNVDDTSTGGPPGNNADDRIYFVNGIDAGIIVDADREGEPVYAQDLFGSNITLAAEITFIQECGTTNLLIQLDGTLTANGTDTKLTTTVPASEYAGDYFGFVTRARARNYVEGVPGTPEGQSLPWVMDYRSFSITDTTLTLSIAKSGGSPGDVELSWNSQAGKRYSLWSSNAVAAPCSPWTLVGTDIVPTPPINTVTISPAETLSFFVVEEYTPPPVTVLSENFDAAAALPAGWVSSGPSNGTDWEVGEPIGLLAAPPSTNNCAGTAIGGNYTANVNVTLTTPSLAIPDGASGSLSFQQYIDTDLVGDSGSVRVLDADLADAPIAGLEITGIGGINAGWALQTLPLPVAAVGGKNIKIQFQFVSDSLSEFLGFYIDDVTVIAQPQ